MRRKSVRLRNKSRLDSTSNAKTEPIALEASVTLLDLPTEMLAWIADFLDGKDLLSLRLTHSVLSAAADDAFAKTFFRKRKHTFTTESLETLAEISWPSNWVTKMKSIELCAVGIDHDKFGTDDEKSSKRRTRFAKRREDIYDMLLDEVESHELQEYFLTTIFENLEDSFNGVVDLDLTRSFSEKQTAGFFGTSQLLKKLGTNVGVSDLLSRTSNTAFIITMKALTNVDYQPFRFNCYMCKLSLSSFDTLITAQPDSPLQWSCLSMLNIGFSHPHDQWHPPHTSALEVFLSAAESLSYLSLQFNEGEPGPIWDRNNAIAWLVTATSDLALDYVGLVDVATHASDLIALTDTHADKLKHLTLCMVRLPDDECWSTVFSSLRTLNLSELSITAVTTGCGDDKMLFVNEDDEEEIEIFGGEEEVLSHLHKFSSNPEYVNVLWDSDE